MEFFRKHRKIIVIALAVVLVSWMIGISAVVGVILAQ